MDDVIFRQSISDDQPQIDEIQMKVFHGEQDIPAELMSISEEKSPIWYVALYDGTIIGTCAAWSEDGREHFGRYALQPSFRGRHIGTRLIRYAFDDLFGKDRAIDTLYMEARDISVHIICAMGAKIVGNCFMVGNDLCTPITLKRADYLRYRETVQ